MLARARWKTWFVGSFTHLQAFQHLMEQAFLTRAIAQNNGGRNNRNVTEAKTVLLVIETWQQRPRSIYLEINSH